MEKSIYILMIFLLVIPVSAQNELVQNDETYNILVVAENTDYSIFDLNKLDQTANEVLNSSDNSNFAEYPHEFSVSKGFGLNISFVSSDKRHGLAIHDLDFELIAERPLPKDEYGTITSGVVMLPSNDIVLKTNATLFVGLGTEDMVIEFIVGNPSGINSISFPTLTLSIFVIIVGIRIYNRSK